MRVEHDHGRDILPCLGVVLDATRVELSDPIEVAAHDQVLDADLRKHATIIAAAAAPARTRR